MATRLKSLVLNEVSLVDAGANQHAHVTLFKRDSEEDAEVEAYLKRKFDAKERKDDAKSGSAMKDGSFSIENRSDLKNAVRAYGRAKDKDAAKKHIISRARALGATSELPSDWKVGKSLAEQTTEADVALAKSLSLILADTDDADREAALAETFKQYHDHLQALHPSATETLKKEDTMSDELKTQVADITKKLDESNAALAKVTKELAFAKLSDSHKAYASEKVLKDADLDAFVAKSEVDREIQIKAAPIVKTVDPEITKRDTELADLRKRLEATEEKNAVADFAKKAVDLGLTEAHGETLRKAYAGDKEAMGKIEQLIKGLTEQVKTGKVFAEFGSDKGADATSPVAKVNAKVAEMQKVEPKLTRSEAIAKIAADPKQRDLWNEYKAA